MATIKSHTDLEQSKKLAEILPLESADMYYFDNLPIPKVGYEKEVAELYDKTNIDYIPCWSLAALLSVLPVVIGDLFEKDALRLRMDKSETDFSVWYDNLDGGGVEEGLDLAADNPVDACVEMILKLHEQNIL